MGEETKFDVMLHWSHDYTVMKDFDADLLCFMDLQSHVYKELRVDCQTKIEIEGTLPDKRWIPVEDDDTLLKWVRENLEEGIDQLHLFIEIENPTMFANDNNVNVHGSSNDETFILSDDSMFSVEGSDDGDLNVPGGYDEGYDIFDIGDEGLGTDNGVERPYMDRAYQGKIYEPTESDKIILEKRNVVCEC